MSTVRMGIRSLIEGVRAMNLQSKLMEKQLDSLQEKFEASATRVEERLEAMITRMEVMLFSVQQPFSHQSQQSISQSKKTLDFNPKIEPPKTTTTAAAPLIDRPQKLVSASHFGFLKENGSSASSSLELDLDQFRLDDSVHSFNRGFTGSSVGAFQERVIEEGAFQEQEYPLVISVNPFIPYPDTTEIPSDPSLIPDPSHDLLASGMAESKSVGTFSPLQNQEDDGEVRVVIVEPVVRVIVEGDINRQEINKLSQLHFVKSAWAILSCAQSLKTRSQSRCSKGKGTYLQLKEFLNVSSLIACENATKKFLLLWFRWWEEYRGGMKIVKEIVGATVRNFLREFVVTSFSSLDLELDFYGSMKLINYVRSQVAKKKCWSFGLAFECSKDLLEHLHAPATLDGLDLLWEDDAYLKPFMVDDALLHSFADNDEDDENYTQKISKEEVMRELMNVGSVAEIGDDCSKVEEKEETVENMTQKFEKVMSNGAVKKETNGGPHEKQKDLKVSFANVGAYGSFSIHREMISDKVRTGAYRDAIVSNPSLLKQSTVVDVGCGTGIVSLFAAQAGASRVIAVEASAKMASVATQIAKDNGLLSEKSENGEEKWCSRVINVVQTMIEDFDNCIQIQPHSVDIIVSEWMGYCLLYESKLLQHTTTVYLHHAIAEYAEALASKMTGHLKVVYFVNSGTEANELATLMARLYTGNLSMIALRNSHHGGSAGTLGPTGLHTWKYPIPQGEVLHVMNPNPHRGAFGSDATCYAKEVEDHIAFGSSGQVAGFIAETFQGAEAACHVPDAFGEQMMRNLESRGCPLLGIHATTGMILSLRESLQSCKDNLAACQAELEAAQSEIRKWYSAFQSGPVSPAGTNPEPALVITDLQNLKSSEESLKERLEKAKKREAAFIVTFAKREQEIVDLKSTVRDLKKQLRPPSSQTRRLLFDPAIHEEFTRLKNLVEEKEKKVKELQDNVSAVNFSTNSKLGQLFGKVSKEVKRAYCNCLIDLCVNLNQLERG